MDKTLIKGLTLLEALVEARQPKGVAELSRELGWSRSNVHRILQTLCSMGYAQADNGKYTAGLKLWSLGSQIIGRVDVKSVSAPILRRLADESNETVHLSVYEGGDVVYIDKIESSQPIRAYTEIGGRAPSWAVATGKALLAFQPAEEIGAICERLEGFTDNTLSDPETLRTALSEVRATGYAVNRGEWRPQVSGVGAPIRDTSGRVVAAIGVSGPSDRFAEPALVRLVPLVRAAAANVSAALGHVTKEGMPA